MPLEPPTGFGIHHWNLNGNLDKISVIFNIKPLFYVFFKYKFVNQKRKQNWIGSTIANDFKINMARPIKFACNACVKVNSHLLYFF